MLKLCLLLLCVWSFLDEQVTAQFCKVPHLTHGRVRSWQRKRLVKYSCYTNYDLVGERYSSCVNGQWDMPVPVCIRFSPTSCLLPKVENGYIIPSRGGAWLMFFCLPHYKLEGSPEIYCDGRQWNDTAPQCVKTTNPSQLSCDFESPTLCGWTQDSLHDFDWLRLNKKTPSSFLFTGPSYDHTFGSDGSGFFMYIESTSRIENDTARLISPIYEAALAEDGCFSFYYHMYGRGIGGLRVYQKPDYVSLKLMLANEEERGKYQLFEMWGSQGNAWYEEVAMLKNFSDNFQIVIEGIRGRTFTSDIAIDDVAILQGINCTAAKKDVSTPSNILPDSCEGRCTVNTNETQIGCSCHVTCFVNQTCCHDFFDICFYNWDSTMEDSSQYPIALPQTEKLVNITTHVSSPTIAPITTVSTTTLKKITSAPKSTTSTTTKTPTTKTMKTTKVTTTEKSKANITNATIYITNGTKATTLKSTVTQRSTKATPVVVKTFNSTVVNTKSTTKVFKEVTQPTKVMRRTTVVREEAKIRTIAQDQHIAKKTGSSAWKPVLITIAVILCCGGLIWILVGVRGARGRAALDYLRGRSTNDPEVRYLHANDEDETSY